MDEIDGTLIQTITIPDESELQEDVQITDSKYIGSYNWIKQDSPTIIVPGMPTDSPKSPCY